MSHTIFQNKKIFYRKEGVGKLVILIHGFAETGEVWADLAKSLKQNFTVIIPDLPGSGKSEIIEAEMTMELFADVIKQIHSLEIKTASEPFSIIGHSMGGYIALAFAEKYEQSINSLGLFHSSCFSDTEEKKRSRENAISFVTKNGTQPFLQIANPDLFSEKSRQNSPDLIERFMALSKHFSCEAFTQYCKAMMLRPDRSSILKEFKRPVLFIQGEHDAAVPLSSGLKQVHLPGTCHFHILKNSGHMGMWEEPKIALKYMQDFLLDLTN